MGIVCRLTAIVSTAAMRYQHWVHHEYLPLLFCHSNHANNVIYLSVFCGIFFHHIISSMLTSLNVQILSFLNLVRLFICLSLSVPCSFMFYVRMFLLVFLGSLSCRLISLQKHIPWFLMHVNRVLISRFHIRPCYWIVLVKVNFLNVFVARSWRYSCYL
jgi:hypothetical protein